MNRMLLSLFTLAGLATTNLAFAADMPVKAPPLVAPVSSSWAGPYVGVQLGGEWTSDKWTTNCVQGSSTPPFNCGGTANPFIVDSSSPHTFRGSGFRGGVYAGVNWQNGPWVYGGEMDWAWADRSSTVAGLVGCSTASCLGGIVGPFSLAGDSTRVKNDWDASLRARFGYTVVPNMLLYGTGGLAFQEISASMTCAAATSPACTLFNLSEKHDSLRFGWTVGAGLEWMVAPSWVLRGEYRYADFGRWKANFFEGSGDVELLNSIKVTTQIATFGVAYKFGMAR